MTDELTYQSVLPSITFEFQDNSFLDVDDIVGVTLTKTEDNLPLGVAVINVRFGKRPWHSIKNIKVNGQLGRLISFERYGQSFDFSLDEDYEDDEEDTPYDFAKIIVKYELAPEEVKEILIRKSYQPRFMLTQDEGEEDETEIEDTSPVLQRSEDFT